MVNRILLISPHPDDAFIGCGGYVLKNGSNLIVDIVCLASSNLQPSDDKRIAEEIATWESVENSSDASVNLYFFKQGKDTQLSRNTEDIIQYIESLLKSHKYDRIFTPFIDDTHQDHREASMCTLSASRYQKNIFFYETPSTLNFHPSIFLELKDEEARIKTHIARHYESQVFGTSQDYKIDLCDYVKTRLLATGLKSRVCKYAEGYKPYRSLF
tara:strand:+ start:128 stop:769 length:642 start_codon:yes stop_codon:yes gene_type:complete